MPCVAWEKCSVLTAPQDAILCVQVDLRRFEVTLERGKIHSASTTTGTSGTNFAHKTSAACSYLQLPVLLAATPKALPQDVRKTLLQIRAASSNLTTAYLAIQNVFILRPSRWPGTCAQPCGPLYRLRSMLSMFQEISWNILCTPLNSALQFL